MDHETSFDKLLAFLDPLAWVRQQRRYHPEGDVLYHCLQVYESAKAQTDDPVLQAAALFHDVGKGWCRSDHPQVGADLLSLWANPRVCWLVEHHLWLAHKKGATPLAAPWPGALQELAALRAWDLAGRRANVWVPDLEQALGELFQPGAIELWLRAEPQEGA